MLIRIHKIIIRAVVQEQKPEPDRKAAHRRAPVAEARVRGPREDEEANGDEPAAKHHRYQANFSGRFAAMARVEGQVVLVYEGSAGCGSEDANCDGDEHWASCGRGVVLAALVNNGVGDEEHVEEIIEDGHVET